MVEFSWHVAHVPVDLPIRQVYGVLVSPEHAIQLLPYGSISEELINYAIKITKKYDFYHQQNFPDEVLNEE